MAEGKRSKYDTDPLDPDFARRTEEIIGQQPTSEFARETQNQQERNTTFSEEPTRQFQDPTAPYPSVFVPPTYQPPTSSSGYQSYGGSTLPPYSAPGTQQPSPPPHQEQNYAASFAGKIPPSSQPVPKLGIPENVALILPYTPFYIGLVASLVELLLVPRDQGRVRFHAAQGLALQLAILAITFLFKIVAMVTGVGFGGWLFWLAATAFLIISMVRIWQGEKHHIAPLAEFTNRINQQFEPRK